MNCVCAGPVCAMCPLIRRDLVHVHTACSARLFLFACHVMCVRVCDQCVQCPVHAVQFESEVTEIESPIIFNQYEILIYFISIIISTVLPKQDLQSIQSIKYTTAGYT